MIELFGFLRSRSNRPHWALEELGVDYRFYQLDFRKGDARSDFFLNLNPAGKIPVLRDGAIVLTESGAICNYLGEKYPKSGLTPPSGSDLRPEYDRWMFFVQTELEQPLWNIGKHKFGLPKEYRIAEMRRTALYEWGKALDLLSQHLEGREFMVGTGLTVIDLCVAHTLRWALNFECPVEGVPLAFLERMEARPSFTRMLEKELLPLPAV
jgi:glutathione S-transferase